MKDEEKETEEYINQQIRIIDEFKTEQFRYDALINLVYIEGDIATKKLLQAIKEEESEEGRNNVIHMLQKRHVEGLISEALIPSYAKALMDSVKNEKNVRLRHSAVWALGWLGVDYSTKKVVTFLIDIIKKEENREVCKGASTALVIIANRNEEGKDLIFEYTNSEDFKAKFWSTIALFQCKKPDMRILSLIDEFRSSIEIDLYYTKIIDTYIRKKAIERRKHQKFKKN